MKRALSLGVMLLLCLFAGCTSDDPQKVVPQARGQRGESCQARNDCASGLACISGTCSRNDFDVEVSVRQCDVVECQTQNDCCGSRPTTAPADCERRNSICNMPNLPGCVATACSSDLSCGTGTCRPGICSNDTSTTCMSQADCADACTNGVTCDLSGLSCTSNLNCFSGTCLSRTCVCANPEYDPTNPICTSTACTSVCKLVCEDERCVADTSCTTNADCIPLGSTICSDGQCVQCETDDDCDVADGESCESGSCTGACKQDEECPLFHECRRGECIETGCTSDRECVLAASGTMSSEDARLAECLPSDADPNINSCKVPCENDGECGAEFQICDQGFCKFVGCESDQDCRAYLKLANEEVTELRPFIRKAVCRE